MKFTDLEASRAANILTETGVRYSQTFKDLSTLAERTKLEDNRTIYAIMSMLGMTSQCLYVILMEQNHNRKISI